MLVQQVLHHIGSLDAAGNLQWKRDLEGGDVLPTLTTELLCWADELQHKLRDHKIVPLLARTAAFCSQWHTECGEACRRLAAAARSWSDALRHRIADTAPAEQPALYNQCAAFLMSALMCYATIPYTAQDVRTVCRLWCGARNSLLFGEGTAGLRVMELACQRLMATRIHDVVTQVWHDVSVCWHAVQEVVQDLPEGIRWAVVDGPTARQGWHDGHLYAVDLLTGIVLIGGNPPRRLPSTITDHPLYKRVFGDITFEISLLHDQTYRTSVPFRGCFYKFAELRGGRLLVREIAPGSGPNAVSSWTPAHWASLSPSASGNCTATGTARTPPSWCSVPCASWTGSASGSWT